MFPKSTLRFYMVSIRNVSVLFLQKTHFKTGRVPAMGSKYFSSGFTARILQPGLKGSQLHTWFCILGWIQWDATCFLRFPFVIVRYLSLLRFFSLTKSRLITVRGILAFYVPLQKALLSWVWISTWIWIPGWTPPLVWDIPIPSV